MDVRALKEVLWSEMRSGGGSQPDDAQSPLSFRQLLGQVPEQNRAGALPDLSVHLCFICLLHLANENGLQIQGSSSLDELVIGNLPSMAT